MPSPPPVVLEYATPLNPFLRKGERLVWFGQPEQGLRLRWGQIVAGSALGLTVLAVAVEVSVRRTAGFPELALGICCAAFTWWSWAEVGFRRNTWYGVTDRRVIILWGEAADVVRSHQTSHELRDIAGFELLLHGDDTGSVLLVVSEREQEDAIAY